MVLAAILTAAGVSTPVLAQSAAPQPAALAQAPARILVKAPPGFRESCARFGWLCGAGAPAAEPLAADRLLALAETVNRRVNIAVEQLSDPENYGVAEYWTLPANGRGDCEDFVLQKYKDLVEAGVPGRDLSVAIVLDSDGNNHAVLVLHHPDGDLVLDSLAARIVPWNQSGYRFLAMQSTQDKTEWEVVASTSLQSARLAMR